MMKRKRSIVRSCFVLTMVLSFPVCGQASDLVKKVISFSGTPNARVFHENVEEMERLMPVVDGVTIYPVTDKGGVTTEALGRLFRADFHRLEDFDTGIDLMRTASTRLYRDNFLLVYLTSGVHSLEIPDWLDPEFEAVVNNWMVAAEYCKLAGMRGLLFDNEAYYGTNLWTYQNLKHKNSTTADEYRDLVFERGAQIMRAINTVYPDIAILCLYGPTQASLSGGRRAYNRFRDDARFLRRPPVGMHRRRRHYRWLRADVRIQGCEPVRKSGRYVQGCAQTQPGAGKVRPSCPGRLPGFSRLGGFFL